MRVRALGEMYREGVAHGRQRRARRGGGVRGGVERHRGRAKTGRQEGVQETQKQIRSRARREGRALRSCPVTSDCGHCFTCSSCAPPCALCCPQRARATRRRSPWQRALCTCHSPGTSLPFRICLLRKILLPSCRGACDLIASVFVSSQSSHYRQSNHLR